MQTKRSPPVSRLRSSTRRRSWSSLGGEHLMGKVWHHTCMGLLRRLLLNRLACSLGAVAGRTEGSPGPESDDCDNPYCGAGTRMSSRACSYERATGPHNTSVHYWPFRA